MQNEFKKYFNGQAIHNSNKLDIYKKTLNSVTTPMIVEERELNITVLSVFDRLMLDGILWVPGKIDETMSTVIQAQLLFLDSSGEGDITLHINSGGGSVNAGLSMVDVMDLVKSDIRTVNTGMAASMGAVLLAFGAIGKRASLRFSKTMIHQSSAAGGGNIQDARIWMSEWEKDNKLLIKLLSERTGKTQKQILKDSQRDKWMGAEETLKYGLIDEIVLPHSKNE